MIVTLSLQELDRWQMERFTDWHFLSAAGSLTRLAHRSIWTKETQARDEWNGEKERSVQSIVHLSQEKRREREDWQVHLPSIQHSIRGKVHGRLNASWKISCLAVNGQSFLVIDGYLLNLDCQAVSVPGLLAPPWNSNGAIILKLEALDIFS